MDVRTDETEKLPVLVKAKKEKRGRDIAYLPTRQHHSRTAVAVGVLCRALLAAMFAAGICLFIADSVEIVPKNTSAFPIFYSCFLFTVFIAVICRGRKFAPLGALFLVGFFLIRVLLVSTDIAGVIVGAAAIVHNAVISRFAFAGLSSIGAYAADTALTAGFDPGELYAVGLMMLSLILCAVFVPIIIRRFSAILVSCVTAVFVVPCFLYNIMMSNWGFAVFVSAAVGVAVLRIHDTAYTVPTKKKRLIADDEIIGADEYDALKLPRRQKAKKTRRHRDRKAKKGSQNEETIPELLTPEQKKERRKKVRLEKKKERDAEREVRRAERKRIRAEKREYSRKKREIRAKKRDCVRNERPGRKKLAENAALGGASGLSAAVISLVLIALPANFVNESNAGIPYLDEIMKTARNYVTAAISSDEVDLNNVSLFGFGTGESGPRPTDAPYPNYAYVPIATVEAPYSSPIYLRAWIGIRYGDNLWYSADMDEAEDFRKQFGEDFSPESITENFYSVMYPSYMTTLPDSAYVDNTRVGFILERVSVTRKYPSSAQILYLPSFVRPSAGLMTYRSNSRAFLPHKKYFDGVWTSKFFFEGTSFATESYVTTMRYPEVGDAIYAKTKEYGRSVDLIESGDVDDILDADESVKRQFADDFAGVLAEYYGIHLNGDDTLIYRYLFDMTDEERDEFVKNAEVEKEYAEYVRDTYLQTSDDNDSIKNFALSVLGETDIYYSRDVADGDYHDIVMELINYMSENFTYSTQPPETEPTGNETGDDPEEDDTAAEPEDENKSAILRFLTDTKRGYCVQFASSLTLMLRSIGIPARYCEGFIADDLERTSLTGGDPIHRYSDDLLDSNAHAWVEVYYDGLGWVQYEATPAFADGMYGEMMSALPEINGDFTPSDVEITDNPLEDDDDDTDPRERIIRIIIYVSVSVVGLGLVVSAVYLVILCRRSHIAAKRRAELIERGKNAGADMTEEELRKCSEELCRGIFSVYSALGLGPQAGELHDAYASRIEGVLGDASAKRVTDILEYVVCEQFGHALPRDEIVSLAEYYEELTENVYKGLSPKNKFVIRYYKNIL